jgi:hypothetical protein
MSFYERHVMEWHEEVIFLIRTSSSVIKPGVPF